MQKRYTLGVLAVVIAAAIGFGLLRRSPAAQDARAERRAAAPVAMAPSVQPAPSAGPVAPAAPAAGDPGHVRRLAADDRRRLGALIAAAAQQRARAAAPPGAGAPPAEDPILPVEAVAAPLQDALTQAIPIVAECFKSQPGGEALREAMARMTMTSDPELGTVIDTEGITDASGAPVAAKIDECLRDTIESLALPPLGSQAGKVKLQYTFKYD
jgi:hypothetical protein